MISPSVQKYSRDGYLRLTSNALYRTVFTHLYSEPLSNERFVDEAKCKGTTEWRGEAGDKVLSLSWDWRWLDDGALVIDREHTVRTNVMLTCEKGYDVGLEITSEMLLECIDTMPWQTEVDQALQPIKEAAWSSSGGELSRQRLHLF